MPDPPKLLNESSIIPPSRPRVSLRKCRSRIHLSDSPQLKNNLLAGVGYLELANAGDFAANIWNKLPVPGYAVVLMAIGGVLALLMAGIAIWDLTLAWVNMRVLREERNTLFCLRTEHAVNTKNSEIIDARIGINFRELGTEVVDRVVMDGVMGFGSILVGTGTLMAIWGHYPAVFLASNFLSGYVGNSMAALFGLSNALWSAYIFFRFRRLQSAVRRNDSVTAFKGRLITRFRQFQGHALLNMLNGLVSGAASMVTATMWWGYVVLIPCILSLILCNYFWRWKLGYDRAVLRVDYDRFMGLPEELDYVIGIHEFYVEQGGFAVDTSSLEDILRFMEGHHMFEGFAEWLILDKAFCAAFFQGEWAETTVGLDDLANRESTRELLLAKSTRILQETGLRTFAYKERYLLELVGYAAWNSVEPASFD